MNNLQACNKKQVMTVKEIAEAIGVSTDTVKNCIRRIMPNKMQNGKTTFLNEQEVTMISKELKSNTFVSSHQTYEVSSQVKNTTTRLEVLANYKAATQAMIELLEAEKAELQAENAKQAGRIQELEHQVEYNEVIDCLRWTDVKKKYHLTKLTKEKIKSLISAERKYWFEKCMGNDNFPTLLIKPEAIDLLVMMNEKLKK